jgi:hypothetical protein
MDHLKIAKRLGGAKQNKYWEIKRLNLNFIPG